MSKLINITLVIISITFFSCSSDNKDQVDSLKLRQIITLAISGDQDANKQLNGLLSAKHIGKYDYNQLSIDSANINGTIYYSLLLEYFDPTLNLLAIYDDKLNFYLLDKSLNGNLSVEWAAMGTRNFAFLQERFLTKDVLSLDRLSIYEIKDKTIHLIYRSLSRFVIDDEISTQTVEVITSTYILTNLSGVKDRAINNKSDTFYLNSDYGKYLSRWNLFNNYVKQQIKEFNWISIKPQIPSEMLEDENIRIREGYQISLDKEWEEVPYYRENKLLMKSLVGTKFYNKALNSRFVILEMPPDEKAENYSPYAFGKYTTGNYIIRETDVFQFEKNYCQIVEHRCGEKQFLLLFECPTETYLQNKEVFDRIIKSFTIKC